MRMHHENKFDEMEYDDFYEHHFFQPVSDEDAINAHRIFPRVAWALDIAKEIKPKSVLDLGCLEGYAVLTLASHVDSVERGYGIDLSEDGIKLASQRATDNKLNVEFERNALENALIDHPHKYDLIMAFEVMEHVKDPELVWNLIDHVAAPDATVLISTPAFESPTYGKDDEQNKCHVRLYTLEGEDYYEKNKYGTRRKATSLPTQLGPSRKIISAEVFSELIHARYTPNSK